jgi:hypothetical protein
MTHGNVWIPLNGQILYCEAWSDGYLDGVGFGALCSSKQIPMLSKLSEIFYGSPFFYEPTTGNYIAKEGDYIIEGYGDVIDDETILKDAEKTLELVLAGDLENAFKTKFAQLSFDERMKLDIGINAEHGDAEQAWNNFIEGAEVLNVQDACEIIVAQLKKNETLDEEADEFEINEVTRYSYFWKDGQFWVPVEINEKIYIIPLMIPCAFSCGERNVYGDIGYLKDMIEADKQVLITLRDTLVKNDMSVDLLFGGCEKELIKHLV